MNDEINAKINECTTQAQKYSDWLNLLRYPNLFLVGGGSLLAFVGGAAVINKLINVNLAGYLSLAGGALTGFHGWLGCEAHQQKCRTIEARYKEFKVYFEALLAEKNNQTGKYAKLLNDYAGFVGNLDAKPWLKRYQ